MGKPKIRNISKMVDHRVKQMKIWDSWYYSVRLERTFHARFLQFCLGTFGSLAKFYNF